MTVPPLPQAFTKRMRTLLENEAAAYFAAMEQPSCRGLRQNPFKQPHDPLGVFIDGLGQPVPWEPNGVLLSPASRAGAHPLHEAGAYYLQEPSAMLPATLLAVQPGDTVLDLCAAPGGKSTQLAAALQGRGTLVSNEIVPGRAQILSRNLERMGVPNALVVNADPARLAEAWPRLFDVILVDAPCSGEGMFRRHPETRLEWDEGAPERCARRQMLILESACAMLREGGRLCYSTCTFSPEENEGVVATLLHAHPELEPVPFSVPVAKGHKIDALDGMIRLYPHQIAGEGQFAALFRKTSPGRGDIAPACALLPAAQSLGKPDRFLTAAFLAFWQESSPADAPMPNACLGNTLLCAPELPPLRNIRVLRAGLALGQMKGRVFSPDHALAVSAPPPPIRSLPLSHAEVNRYLAGETLRVADDTRGYYTVTFAGLPLGFGKASDGTLKNHYPKGLRRALADAPEAGGETDGNDET